jgi:hypothetical protein
MYSGARAPPTRAGAPRLARRERCADGVEVEAVADSDADSGDDPTDEDSYHSSNVVTSCQLALPTMFATFLRQRAGSRCSCGASSVGPRSPASAASFFDPRSG